MINYDMRDVSQVLVLLKLKNIIIKVTVLLRGRIKEVVDSCVAFFAFSYLTARFLWSLGISLLHYGWCS